MRVFDSVASLRAAAGEHLGYSDWHAVTQEQINQFADATGDHQWIHVDPELAAKGPFGTTVAHGYLTLSLIPMLVSEILRVDGVRMGINYGTNKVRFPAPLPVGSRVRAGSRSCPLRTSLAGCTSSTRSRLSARAATSRAASRRRSPASTSADPPRLAAPYL